MLPYFKAVDVVEGPSEVERSAEVSLLNIDRINWSRVWIYTQDIVALIFENPDECALAAADIYDSLRRFFLIVFL
jgi:hypothetical protein